MRVIVEMLTSIAILGVSVGSAIPSQDAVPPAASNAPVEVTWIERVVGTLGVPVGLLIVVVISIVRIARWLAPRAEEAFRKHTALLDTTTETVEAVLEHNHAASQKIGDHLDRNTEALKTQTQAIQALTTTVQSRRSA